MMMTGVANTAGAQGRFSPALVALAGAFDGPHAVVDARGSHRDAPIASGIDMEKYSGSLRQGKHPEEGCH